MTQDQLKVLKQVANEMHDKAKWARKYGQGVDVQYVLNWVYLLDAIRMAEDTVEKVGD